MVKDWAKKIAIFIFIIIVVAVLYDTAKIFMAYYSADRSANNIAEQIAVGYKTTATETELRSQAENLAKQEDVIFDVLKIENKQIDVTIIKKVEGTLITSQFKSLSSFNTLVAQGNAPVMEIKSGDIP